MVFYIVWLDVYASLFHSQFILFAIKIQELQHKNSEQETAGINEAASALTEFSKEATYYIQWLKHCS